MKQQIFAVRDIKAKAFALPFCQPNLEMAIRAYRAAASDPQSMLFKYPDDYQLYHLGEFNDTTGTIDAFVQPALISGE